MSKEKNPAAVALGSLGGSKRSEKQKHALEENRKKRWPKNHEQEV